MMEGMLVKDGPFVLLVSLERGEAKSNLAASLLTEIINSLM